jgi:hypothetical protein
MNIKPNYKSIEPPEDLPLLRALCWNIAEPMLLTPQESNWRFNGVLAVPNAAEIEWIEQLCRHCQGSPLIIEQNAMTKDEYYKILATIINSLNSELLSQCQTYLSGGALVNLSTEAIRLSQDIDFLCTQDGYRQLRQQITRDNCQTIFNKKLPPQLELSDRVSIDRYGIRLPLFWHQSAETIATIKIKFVVEGWLQLGSPNYLPGSTVPCLNREDLIAAKLLANADRWADSSKHSRDLIDLCLLRTKGELPSKAYPVRPDLIKSIEQFQNNPDYRERCYKQLAIEAPVKIIEGLDFLATDFRLSLTERTFQETDFGYLDR